jgi:hypothetical protein
LLMASGSIFRFNAGAVSSFIFQFRICFYYLTIGWLAAQFSGSLLLF